MPILLAPWLTEKSVRLADLGQYAFLVTPNASKQAVADAVEAHFKVKVTAVTMETLKGKRMRMRGKGAPRRLTTRGNRKKAIVRLAAGQRLDVYGGVEEGAVAEPKTKPAQNTKTAAKTETKRQPNGDKE